MNYGWIIVVLAVSACTPIVENTERASHYVRSGIYNSAEKVQEYTRYNPPPDTPQLPQEGYCYHALSDIICYDRPQPGITNRLVGYQGEPPLHAPMRPVTHTTFESGQVTPFFVNEAPYVKDDGTVKQSVKVLPNTAYQAEGESGSRVIAPGRGDTSAAALARGRNPAVLMPRF